MPNDVRVTRYNQVTLNPVLSQDMFHIFCECCLPGLRGTHTPSTSGSENTPPSHESALSELETVTKEPLSLNAVWEPPHNYDESKST